MQGVSLSCLCGLSFWQYHKLPDIACYDILYYDVRHIEFLFLTEGKRWQRDVQEGTYGISKSNTDSGVSS